MLRKTWSTWIPWTHPPTMKTKDYKLQNFCTVTKPRDFNETTTGRDGLSWRCMTNYQFQMNLLRRKRRKAMAKETFKSLVVDETSALNGRNCSIWHCLCISNTSHTSAIWLSSDKQVERKKQRWQWNKELGDLEHARLMQCSLGGSWKTASDSFWLCCFVRASLCTF